MKVTQIISILLAAGLTWSVTGSPAQHVETQSDAEAVEGLDLQAVAELFKEAENLESFEKMLNDPETGINNLDLDENGQVDYIRVVEQEAGEARLIILQVPLEENEYQDVAAIEIEPEGDDGYAMQVSGNETVYGPGYYIAPVNVRITAWPIIRWMYRPGYRPYVSVYRWGYYPGWWKPRRPVAHAVYHARVLPYRHRAAFRVTHVRHVTVVNKVKYTPRTSVRVTRKTVVRPGRRPGQAGAGSVTAKRTVTRTRGSNQGAAKVTRTTTVRKKK